MAQDQEQQWVSPDTSGKVLSDEASLYTSPMALDALFGSIYERALGGDRRADLLECFCKGLAKYLKLPLVLVAYRNASGAVVIAASSAENALWLELHRISERWDGTVAGNGPAGCALRSGASAAVRVADEGFLPWRVAAERDGIGSGAAWPLADGVWVLELFSLVGRDNAVAAEAQVIASVVDRLGRFLKAIDALQKQKLLARALECAGYATYVTDLEGTIIWANRAFAEMSGYDPEEVIGQNPRILQSGQQGLRYYRELWSTIRSGKTWSGETVERSRDGRIFTVRQTISPVALEDRITHFISVNHDISRHKQQQTLLERRQGMDPVTGLLTRAAFEELVEKVLAAPGAGIALALITLHGLQRAVAALSTETEDMVAEEVGQRILESVQSPSAAGVHLPGEYVLLLATEPIHKRTASHVLEDLRRRLEEPYPIIGDQLDVGFRASIARYPEDGGSFAELIKHADRLLAQETMPRPRRKWPAA